MFEALANSSLPKQNVFACTVGASSKRTKASYHLLEPADVVASVASLVKPRAEALSEQR
jgi:trehalose 6-phosphate synthase/phosphatase